MKTYSEYLTAHSHEEIISPIFTINDVLFESDLENGYELIAEICKMIENDVPLFCIDVIVEEYMTNNMTDPEEIPNAY